MNFTSTRAINVQLAFRIVTNVFNIVLLGLLGKAAIAGSDYDINNRGLWDAISTSAPSLSLIWTTLSIVLLFRLKFASNKTYKQHHPAIELSFDLISWLLFWIMWGFMIAIVAEPEGQAYCMDESYQRSWAFCREGGTLKQRLDIASAVLLGLNGLIHLVFFAFACHATKLWRRRQAGRKELQYELKHPHSHEHADEV